MESTDPQHYLNVAKKHLERVQASWDDPTDWDILSTFGFYCLEALIRAAALKTAMKVTKKHWEKEDQARELAARHGLPDVSTLLRDINNLRKASAYGDLEVDESACDAQDIAGDIAEVF